MCAHPIFDTFLWACVDVGTDMGIDAGTRVGVDSGTGVVAQPGSQADGLMYILFLVYLRLFSAWTLYPLELRTSVITP